MVIMISLCVCLCVCVYVHACIHLYILESKQRVLHIRIYTYKSLLISVHFVSLQNFKVENILFCVESEKLKSITIIIAYSRNMFTV